MPPLLLTILLKFALPLTISILEKTGFVKWAEALAFKFGIAVVEKIKCADVVAEYPKSKIKDVR